MCSNGEGTIYYLLGHDEARLRETRPKVKVVPAEFPDRLPAKIAFVGEAPGDHELAGDPPRPLIGPSGWLFNRILKRAGIWRNECLITNVLDFKLEDNKIESITVPKKDRAAAGRPRFFDHFAQPVVKGGYLDGVMIEASVGRLRAELYDANPNVIVALGGLAIWALLAMPGHGVVKKIRGTLHQSVLGPWKVIPTYHPAFVIRKYQMRPMLWADFLKARHESEFPEIRSLELDIRVANNGAELADWWNKRPEKECLVAIDIETSKSHIDCIGFAYSSTHAMTVPFFDNKTGERYWDTAVYEVLIRKYVNMILTSPNPKLFQNGSYDVQWIWEKWGIAVQNYAHDTRLLHHALWPELPKDLGTMASLHTDLPSWKPVRRTSLKRED